MKKETKGMKLMIETLGNILPIFIYLLLIVLLVVGIILGIKLIITMDKLNKLIEDIEEKVHSLDDIFNFANGIYGKISLISSKFSDTIVSLVSKVGKVFKRKEERDFYE